MLTFRQFQKMNQRRCPDWPLPMWALALGGEAYELCSLVKKVHRGDYLLTEKRQDILRKAADVITYADLLISHLEADTETVVMEKFNRVSF